jgi:hypothetical protein
MPDLLVNNYIYYIKLSNSLLLISSKKLTIHICEVFKADWSFASFE